MTRSLFIVLSTATLLTGFVLIRNAQCGEPMIVARVNGDPITRKQFDRMVANPLTLLEAQHELKVEEPDIEELEHLAMRKLVHLQLLVQEAHRRKVTVTQDDLDEAVGILRQQFDDLESFGKWARKQGLSDPELFESIRTDMLASRAATGLAGDIEISEEHIKRYFDAHRENLVIGAEVRLRIIAVREKKEAEEILAELQKGRSFARLAYRRSLGRLASRGGDTGWVDFRSLSKLLQDAVGKLKFGDVAGPLKKAEDEYLLVGLQDNRPLRAMNLDEARSEIRRRLLTQKKQSVVEEWLKEQEREAIIEILL